MKVLIIDDESVVRKNIAAFLEDHNYEVLESENGKEGLEVCPTGKSGHSALRPENAST